MVKIKVKLLLLLLLPCSSLFGQQNQTINFLIVKYGDESANQKLASEFLESFADYFKQHFNYFNNKSVHGWIANNRDSAKFVLNKHNPDFVFAPPGFYLEFLYETPEKATPILQIPRFGKSEERFYLVTSKNGVSTLQGLKNQIVATVFSIDREYLKRVVFPLQFQPESYFLVKTSENLADELFFLIEEASGGIATGEMLAVSALLLDNELKKFFQDDEFVWPELKIIWTSEALPRDLVITMGSKWTDKLKSQFREVLVNMKNNQPGLDILSIMQSSGFTKINSDLLTKTIEKYFSEK